MSPAVDRPYRTSSTSDVSSVLTQPLLLDETILLSYTVLTDYLSLHLKTHLQRQDVLEALNHMTAVGKERWFLRASLRKLHLCLCLVSVTSTNAHTTLRCRTPKDPETAATLFRLAGQPGLSLAIGLPDQGADRTSRQGIPSDDALARLLDEVASRQQSSPQALLQQLTRFHRPDHSVYDGCTRSASSPSSSATWSTANCSTSPINRTPTRISRRRQPARCRALTPKG